MTYAAPGGAAGGPTPAWAASLGMTQLRVSKRGSGAFLGLSPDDGFGMDVAVALLPPGVRAAALGRSALTPGTAEWSEAGMGPAHGVSLRIPAWCAQIVRWHGRMDEEPQPHLPNVFDLPVWVDPRTGKVTDVLHEVLVQEWAPWRELGVWLWKRNEAPLSGVRSAVATPAFVARFGRNFFHEFKDVFHEIRSIGDGPAQPPDGERPDDATHPPIEGVSYRTWVTTSALLERDEVHPTHREAFTAHRGVHPGRWDAVDAAWRAWAAQDPALGAWSAYDRTRLLPTGARW